MKCRRLRQIGSAKMGKQGYWLMDGRANYSIDDALVLECCSTLEEANHNINNYGTDTCIVDPETQEVVDSLMWRQLNQSI